MKCLCGNEKFEAVSKTHYEVTPGGKTQKSSKKGVQFGKCTKCSIIRQVNLPLDTEEAYTAFYKNYPPVTSKYKAKTYSHDLEVAKLRCVEYGIESGCVDNLLDVGSGSGAFVDECRSRGVQAYGCEIADYDCSNNNDFIYKGRFEGINFPTDHFDKVTCHDMLEHVLDPLATIKEMFRVTNQGGQCLIDIPRFFHKAGEHHWKAFEHIWFFDEKQLKELLEKVGFIVREIRHPLDSKAVFYCTKPTQDRPSILVPPGIGDSYWSIIKIQAFLKREGLDIVDICIASPREKKFQGHKRAFPFIEMFPFLKSTGITYCTKDGNKAIWKEAYAQEGRTIFKDVVNCDYFISYNGHLRVGKRMEDIDSDLECNWYPPMFISLEQKNYQKACARKYGKYVLFYFVFQGTYCHWTKEFPVTEVIKSVKAVTEQSGCTPIFVGAQWDAEDPTLIQVKKELRREKFEFVDLTGKTNVDQLFGLIKGSQMLIGYPSGLSILSAVLGAKTIIIWNDYYDRDFAWYACPPKTRGENYFIERTKDLTAEKLAKSAVDIIEGKKPKVILPVPRKTKLPVRNTSVPRQRFTPVMKEKVAIVCVLKSGGDFTAEYVRRLRNMVQKHTTISHDFICFTDIDIDIEGCINIPLQNNFPGCWAKVEMFRPKLIKAKRIIYFDLDTVILGSIDDVLSINSDLVALKPWNKKNLDKGMFASGMMSWKNDGTFTYIYSQFNKKLIKEYPSGDQEYMSKKIKEKGGEFSFFQSLVKDIYSYKRNCRPNKPSNARIVCFHGKPRPHECPDRWVKNNWR